MPGRWVLKDELPPPILGGFQLLEARVENLESILDQVESFLEKNTGKNKSKQPTTKTMKKSVRTTVSSTKSKISAGPTWIWNKDDLHFTNEDGRHTRYIRFVEAWGDRLYNLVRAVADDITDAARHVQEWGRKGVNDGGKKKPSNKRGGSSSSNSAPAVRIKAGRAEARADQYACLLKRAEAVEKALKNAGKELSYEKTGEFHEGLGAAEELEEIYMDIVRQLQGAADQLEGKNPGEPSAKRRKKEDTEDEEDDFSDEEDEEDAVTHPAKLYPAMNALCGTDTLHFSKYVDEVERAVSEVRGKCPYGDTYQSSMLQHLIRCAIGRVTALRKDSKHPLRFRVLLAITYVFFVHDVHLDCLGGEAPSEEIQTTILDPIAKEWRMLLTAAKNGVWNKQKLALKNVAVLNDVKKLVKTVKRDVESLDYYGEERGKMRFECGL